MIKLNGLLHCFPGYIKVFIGVFLLAITLGYIKGVIFIESTSGFTADTIERNYLGNENEEEAEEMFFKKSKKEILTLVHNHILSLSVLFLVVGGLVSIISLPILVKKFLMIEPLISVLVTFEGIYIMWLGVSWMKYLVMASGFLMSLSFILANLLVFIQLFKPEKK